MVNIKGLDQCLSMINRIVPGMEEGLSELPPLIQASVLDRKDEGIGIDGDRMRPYSDKYKKWRRDKRGYEYSRVVHAAQHNRLGVQNAIFNLGKGKYQIAYHQNSEAHHIASQTNRLRPWHGIGPRENEIIRKVISDVTRNVIK